MKAYLDVMTIHGTKVKGDCPMPVFRDPEKDKPSKGDGTLLPSEEYRLGDNTGFRVLPYRMIDKYDRDKKTVYLKTAVLENDQLIATFLPEQGGRLWSLKNKNTGKEILYTNPVYQPANLGIRNAWFSGGIEWNCAQYGHVVYSNSPVFFAKMTAEDGEEFLRMYQFERMKKLFVQIDFHLPDGAKTVYAHVNIFNMEDQAQSMYWWSNIAIRATEGLRVFSGTEDVLYLHPESISNNINPIRVFGRTKMPILPTLPGKDSSYPNNATYSNEFFFQNPENVDGCWSAAAYEDGTLFFERSTLPLRFRKMFCWGRHEGGQRWCTYLANEKEGNYVELQAGLAPTQLNSIDIPANSRWRFTQAIGEVQVENIEQAYGEDYSEARCFIEKNVHGALAGDELLKMDADFTAKEDLAVQDIISMGDGWGALELMMGHDVPASMCFPESTLCDEQYPWLALVRTGVMPETGVQTAPASWMVDEQFNKLLEDSLTKPGGDHYLSRLHLGVMYYEQGRRAEGVEQWKLSLDHCRSPFALRNLAYDAKANGNMEEALQYMREAVAIEDGKIDKAFSEELMDILLAVGNYQEAWDYYHSLPTEMKSQDRLTMQAGVAGVELDHFDFAEALFTRDIACIREGDNTLTDLYERFNVRKLMQREENPMTQQEAEEYVKKNCIPPRHIDFRMFVK